MTAAQRTQRSTAQPSEQVRTYLTALSPDSRQHLEKLRGHHSGGRAGRGREF